MTTPMPNRSDLRAVLAAGVSWLETNAEAVNALNVFPVPDGDTGTNMLLTARTAIVEAARCSESGAGAIARAAAHGALLGARGNGGVILSQIIRGFAEGLADCAEIRADDLVRALDQAAKRAYQGVAHPVEGTILTVIRCAAEAAKESKATSVPEILEHATAGAKKALAETPNLLPVLKEAGVVDAGGQGLVLLLEGALAQLQGHPLTEGYRTLGEIRRGWLESTAAQHQEGGESAWGYCTEFLIQDHNLSVEQLRKEITRLGTSLLVVGDEQAIHVHVHAQDPGAVLSYAASLGTLHKIKIDNMQEQQGDLLHSSQASQSVGIAVVAVVPGDGLTRVFRSLGATAVVPGGQSMNPSAQEIVAAVESIGVDSVLVLPNNPNVIASCEQAQQFTSKRVIVVPSRTIPQGIAALLALNQEHGIDENAAAMTESLDQVRTVEITTATQDATIGGVSARQDQYIGLVEHKLVAAGDSLIGAFQATLDHLDLPKGNLVTLYYGEMVTKEEAETVAEELQTRPDSPEVEVIQGGQPHYHFIASVEM